MNELGRFLTDHEKTFRSLRNEALSNIPSAYIADSPFLFSTRQTITDTVARVALYNMILDVSGHIVECGVNKGNDLMLFAHLSSILEPYAINRKIIGFDTFEGFRSINPEKDPNNVSTSDFRDDSSLSILKKAVSLYDMNRAAGHMSRVTLVQGDATRSIKDYVAKNDSLTIALLYLDFDLYEPTAVALKELLPLVCKGGIVAFDEFNYDKFSGETAAAKEALKLSQVELKRFPFAPFIAFYRV